MTTYEDYVEEANRLQVLDEYPPEDGMEEMENLRRCIERMSDSDVKLHLLNLWEQANQRFKETYEKVEE